MPGRYLAIPELLLEMDLVSYRRFFFFFFLAVNRATHKDGCQAPEVAGYFAGFRSSAGRKRHVGLCTDRFQSSSFAGPHEQAVAAREHLWGYGGLRAR